MKFLETTKVNEDGNAAEENWYSVAGFSKYGISDKGRVKNLKTGSIVKPDKVIKDDVSYRLFNDAGKRRGLHMSDLLSMMPQRN